MKHHHHAAAHGFTLIELMMVVSIIGMLASVALPQYSKATLRSRAAERVTVMESMGRAVNDVVNQQQRVPSAAPPGTRSTWTGVANPAGTPGASKRPFDWTASGWSMLPMLVQGNAYYTYSFVADDKDGDGKTLTLTVTGDGDLDEDGFHSVRTISFVGVGFSFIQNAEAFLDPNIF
jgi:prepilin-type N-terminal cleavage/methylation domain-containing protein